MDIIDIMDVMDNVVRGTTDAFYCKLLCINTNVLAVLGGRNVI
jgi:hypothetical protein